ncbi:hypothetical protein [Flavilitoribacter nigricans]|uniref:Fibronectin type-III domain-containing protein n=1 Tax=Flavilitoribacter nigricans (strain ATCC 23147 / DSM 23189 / NBRC 102662 / NCIMB 1420 / SS-2) TaxID=1122177 RepID=A0A2D0ND69_FLAN2|nr:hypothetical protein [Flavilitoribacter nigricans]PHN06316.1 hypothetical protein CRP01_12140 [Flavilitoribacter nigricans DSM 23189 = NBRC 102662]
MKALSTCLLVLFLTLGLKAIDPEPPQFENPPENFTESGYIKLSWEWIPGAESANGHEFELQQAPDAQFSSSTAIYQGQDFATFLSGLKNGDYYYRVRVKEGGPWSAWSEPTLVRVQHHSLSLAFTLFGLGALVFLLTVGIVVQGNRKVTQNP